MGSTAEVVANQARVWEKLRESRFFLTLMRDYEGDPEKFGFCLSAFLSAFRSIAYRLARYTKITQGVQARNGLMALLGSQPDIAFLTQARNVEVHEDGVVISRMFSYSFADSDPERWRSRWDPWPNRWESRPGPPQVQLRHRWWQFANRTAQDLVDLCSACLNETEEIVRQTLASTP